MKPAKLIFSTILALGASSLFAQTGAQDGSRFGKGEDSVRCIMNTSLYEPYAKAKNYKDALPYWELAYAECPTSSKNLYINGVRIVEWELSLEKDPTKRKALIDKLMGVYDNRMKYFGDDAQYPSARILGAKAVDYLRYLGKDADQKIAFGWLSESVAASKSATSPEVLKDWVACSEAIFKADANLREQYLTTYLKGIEYIDEYHKTAKGGMIQYAEQVKAFLNQQFAVSGAADCDALQSMYASKIEENKNDIEFLKATISLLRRSRCQESDVYFAASEYAHKIQPTMESAVGMGRQAAKKDDLAQAIVFFQEAVGYAVEPADKAEIDMFIASLHFRRKNFPQARTYALRSAENDPQNASAYILIANMYASTAREIYPSDAILVQTVYFAAVDKLERAKQVDPSKASEINALIASYRAHFPKNEDVFMHQDLEKGKTITIGGWIQEKTIVR